MTNSQPHPSLPATRPCPAIPLVAWALGLLAYPVCFLAALSTYPGNLAATLGALPAIAVQGVGLLYTALLAAAVWGVATGAGMVLLRRAGFRDLTTAERAVFGAGLGMGILSLGTFLAGTVSGSPPWLLTALVWVLLAAMAALGAREALRAAAEGVRALQAERRRLPEALMVLLAIAIVLLALTWAHVPVFGDYDALEYHFAAPAQWWRAGRVFFIRDVVYTNFPQNAEMLYLMSMALVGGPQLGAAAGLQVGIGFVVLTAAAIAVAGRRLGSPTAGRIGAALFLTTPMLAELGSMNSYVVELPLTAYGFLALLAFLLMRAAESPRERWRLAVLSGVLVGLAIGCKYTAVLFVLLPIGAFILAGGVLRQARFWRAAGQAGAVGLAALAAASPWLVRNAVNTGNPTYPLLHHVFGSRNWSDAQDVKFTKAHQSADVSLLDLGRRFWAFAAWRDQPGKAWQPPWRPPAAPLLFLFALVPFALADPRSTRAVFYFGIAFLAAAAVQRFGFEELRTSQFLRFVVAGGVLALVTSPAFLIQWRPLVYPALYFTLWLVAWYALTHRVDRFLDPATPAVALLAGVGFAAFDGRWPRRAARWLVVGALAYALATTLLIRGTLLDAGLTVPRDEFLAAVTRNSTYCQPAMETINQKLPADATVLFVGESRTFYCERRVLAASVFDRGPIERLLDRGGPGDPGDRVAQGLRDLGATHIYVNWPEIQRLGSSYAYRLYGQEWNGFSEYNVQALFADMLRRGDLATVASFQPNKQGRPAFVIYELR